MSLDLYKPRVALAFLACAACSEGVLDPKSAYEGLDQNDDAGASQPNVLRCTDQRLQPLLANSPPGDVERPRHVDSRGFFVHEGRLYDAYGNDFVIRGVNNAHAWFDTGNRNDATWALPAIAEYRFNTVRIVWERDAIPEGSLRIAGVTENRGATTLLLRQVVECALDLGIIPMIELHDVTGIPFGLVKHAETGELATRSFARGNAEEPQDWRCFSDLGWDCLSNQESIEIGNELLLDMARHYARDDVKELLLEYEDYLLVNIANEWSGPDFYGGYRQAIDHLRQNGINHTLVIDANGWGQNAESVLENGLDLLDADPQHNLLFSVHMYEQFSENERITQTFETAVELSLPFIVGEFGPEHGGQQIDTAFILAEADRLGLGYIAWSWKGNESSTAHLDMAVDWSGRTLTGWGDSLIYGPFGVDETSQKASVFLD